MILYIVGVLLALLINISHEYFIVYRAKKILNNYKLTASDVLYICLLSSLSWLYIILILMGICLVCVFLILEKLEHIIVYED